LLHGTCVALACILGSTTALAQQASNGLPRQPGHTLLRADVPPGVLGAAGRNGPWRGYYQPVRLFAPQGARLALAQSGGFAEPQSDTLTAGLLVGAVYRFQITEIPYRPGAELYPTLEIIDRLYPPPGLAARFPIPVHLDREDLNNALAGRLVTRVIYLEDPQTALPLADAPQKQRTLDIRPQEDPLLEADRLGRPVAVLRIGSRVPPDQPAEMPGFLYGSPPWQPIETRPSGDDSENASVTQANRVPSLRPANSTPRGSLR
jgi:hypothetical protein